MLPLVTVRRTFLLTRVVPRALHCTRGAALFVVAGDIGANRTGANRRVGRRTRYRARFGADRRDSASVLHAAAAVVWISGRPSSATHAWVVSAEAVGVAAGSEVRAATGQARVVVGDVVASWSRIGGAVVIAVVARIATHCVARGSMRITATTTVRYARHFRIGERAQRSDNRAQRPV